MKVRALTGWLLRSPVPMLVARLVVGIVYLWLGAQKVGDPVAFLKALRDYDLLPLTPPQWMNGTVVVLPWIEIVCGVLLLVGAWLRAAGSLLLLMTVVFTVVIAMRGFEEAARQGLALCAVHFDCGCGTGEVALCRKVLENLGLILLSIVVVSSRSRALSVERIEPAPA